MATYPTFVAPKRTALSNSSARTQAGTEINPLYNQAISNINAQLQQNQNSAVQQAAARGLGRSGLAQDSLNKLAIGAQSDIAGVEAERATKVASLARQLLERDQDVGFRERQQSYSEWNGQQNIRMQTDQFNYQKERDKVADSQWQQEFDYRKSQDAAAAAARAAGGGGGGGGGGGRRSSGGSSRRSSSGGSSGSTWGTDTTSAMTLDQIKWYNNPSNAPYAYGQTKPAAKAPVNKTAPMSQVYAAAAPVKKPLYTPSYAAALPNKKTVVTPTKKGSMSKQSTPWYKKVLGIFS